MQSGSLNILAEITAEEGDEATANELYEESLGLRRELGDKRLIANSVLTLGRPSSPAGSTPGGGKASGGVRARARAGDTWSMSLALTNLGRVALLGGGDAAEAAKLFADGLAREGARRQARRGRVPSGPGAVVGAGDGAQAARLFGACEVLLESIGATPTSIEVALNEQFIPPVRASLGEERFTAEWRAGRAEPPGRSDRAALWPPRTGPRRGLVLSRRCDAARLGGHGGDGRGSNDKHWYAGLHSTRPLQLLLLALVAAVVAPIIGAHYYTGEIIWPLVIGGFSGAALAFTAALFWDRHSRLQDEVRQTEADRRRVAERLQQEQDRSVVEAKRRFGALELELERLKASIERTKREQANYKHFFPDLPTGSWAAAAARSA